jgi:hypothetical protein
MQEKGREERRRRRGGKRREREVEGGIGRVREGEGVYLMGSQNRHEP